MCPNISTSHLNDRPVAAAEPLRDSVDATKEASVRKFLLNPGFIAAIGSGVGVARATKDGPRDWRLALLWASWGIGVALAVGSILDADKQVREEELGRKLAK